MNPTTISTAGLATLRTKSPQLTNRCRQAIAILACAIIPAISPADVVGIREAEQTTITCGARPMPHHMLWASGKAISPAQWGGTAGDSLEFDITLDTYQDDLKLAVRYAFCAELYTRDVPDGGPRELELVIDHNQALPVAVPDTGGWNHFQVAEISLPPLQPGLHHFALTAPTALRDTNIDTFVFYKEPVDPTENGILRPTRLIDPEAGIILCASVDAPLLEPPPITHKTLQNLFDLMSKDFGRPINTRLYFHLTDKSRWWNTEAHVVQNRFGIYFLANGQPYDRAEWCWALANYFVQDSGVPAWFTNSSSRVTGWMDWLPSLPGNVSDIEIENAALAQQQAQALLASPDTTCDKAETVQLALRLKYGNDIFRRFWHLIAEKQTSLAASGAPLLTFDKYETLAILSQAAGEDVTPLFKKWKGFANEGPVDPLVLTLQVKD